MDYDSIVPALKKEYGNHITAENVLAPKGTNKWVDNLVFGEEEIPNSPYPSFFFYEGRIIEEPETLFDVKGQVTADYQRELEAAWVKELKGKYPVKVNVEELSKIK